MPKAGVVRAWTNAGRARDEDVDRDHRRLCLRDGLIETLRFRQLGLHLLVFPEYVPCVESTLSTIE